MKKIVLSLALVATLAFVSCKETAKEETTETTETVEAPVEAPVEEVAPVANDTTVKTEEVKTEEVKTTETPAKK